MAERLTYPPQAPNEIAPVAESLPEGTIIRQVLSELASPGSNLQVIGWQIEDQLAKFAFTRNRSGTKLFNATLFCFDKTDPKCEEMADLASILSEKYPDAYEFIFTPADTKKPMYMYGNHSTLYIQREAGVVFVSETLTTTSGVDRRVAFKPTPEQVLRRGSLEEEPSIQERIVNRNKILKESVVIRTYPDQLSAQIDYAIQIKPEGWQKFLENNWINVENMYPGKNYNQFRHMLKSQIATYQANQ